MSPYRIIKTVIVEDDPMVQRINEEFLSRVQDFECVGIHGTLEGFKRHYEDERPDLVLLDVFLPDGSGIDLLKWIRKQELEIDVILITADKRGLTVDETRRYGIIDYLVKPFRYERFEETLTRYRQQLIKLDEAPELDQDAIDQILTTTSERPKETSKNLTLDSIYRHLKHHPTEGFTASAVAEAVGISRITARRYLEELEQKEWVRMELSYGGVGRPQNLYYYSPKKT